MSCVKDCIFTLTELSLDLSPTVRITLQKIVAGSFPEFMVFGDIRKHYYYHAVNGELRQNNCLRSHETRGSES